MNKNSKLIQYKDFSAWQNVHDITEQEAYWKEEFSGEIPRLDMKTDFLRPQMQSFRGANVLVKANEQIRSVVRKLARKFGATEFMVTLSAFMLLLGEYSRMKEIVVGTAVSGRVHADTKGMLGMFVNTLAIKGEVYPDETFENLLLAVKEKCLQAYDNQEYQFEDLVEAVETKRDFSRNPIFDIMFALKEEESISKAKGLLSGKSALVKRNISKFDLTLTVICESEGYAFDFEYCTDLFKPETIEYMAKHYVTLLEKAIMYPEKKLKDLHMTDAGEEEKVLVEFNKTDVDYPRDMTVVNLFEKQAEKTPESIALKFEDKRMTYAELNARSNQLAQTLRDLGVVPEDRVALITERSLEMIVGILGIIKAGGCYVPINPEYPENRIRYMLEDSAPKAVLTYKVEALEGIGIPVLNLGDKNTYAETVDNLPHVNSPRDLVYCIYTSGTTGNPKGVLIEHRNAVNMWVTYKETFSLNNEDTVLQFASVSFDQAVGDIFPALCNGAALCLVPTYMMYDMDKLQKYMHENSVTTVSLTPKVIEGLSVEKLPTLRLLESGGEAGNLESLKEWAKKIKVLNTYGPTESTVNATSFKVDLDSTTISIGQPISNTKIYLLNGMELCGIGIPGELCIAGEGLARGYLNQPDLTAEKFIKNPFGEGRLYRTGDLARWQPDGNIEYLGRIDEQVKIRGYRIELGEIESVLRKQTKVADVAVIVWEAGGDKSLCAYLIAEQAQELDISEVRESLRAELAEYMIPSFMTQIDELPLTLNGKLDKRMLPEPDILDSWKYVPPRTKTEQTIVQVFEEILGVSPIGIEDSFFELGGHSLKATAAVNAIEKCTGVRLPLKEIFASPTPSVLAKKLEAQGEGKYSPIPKAEKKETYPTSSAQKRLFILDQIEGGSTTYNMPAALEATGTMELRKIQKAIDDLIKRHESLRTSFVLIEGETVQIIADEVSCKVEYEEVENYSEEEMAKFIRPFDLGKAPLMRLKVIKQLKNDKYILLFDMHHIISDDKTMNIMIEDFSKIYSGEVLKPLEIQYKDYSEWMRGRDLESQREYWKKVFEEEVPVLDLATDYPRPKTQSYRGARVSALLNQEQKKGIEKINRENGTTDYMTLLAAFMVELHKYSRQEDIVVGTPISGRVHKDTETIAGMFVNTLAMRGYPSGGKTFIEFLSEIKEFALSGYENQEYAFEELVEQVEVRRDMSRNPLFDVMFAIQNNEGIELSMDEIELRMLEINSSVAKFDLDLQIMKYDEEYVLDIAYCSDLFTKTTAEAMLEHFKTLIDSIIANPEAKLSELEMMSEAERERILKEFNDTYAKYPRDKTVVDLFEEQVERTPEKIAIEYETGALSYREINRKANALAWKLCQLGVRQNDRVAIMASLKAETIVGIMGVLKSGGTYIPIDHEYPEERIRHILDDATPKVILTREKNIATELPMIYMDIENMDEDEKNPENMATKENTAYVIYTSGTTGKPKGVAVTRGNLDNYLSYANRMYQNDACVTALITSLSFDLSVTSLYLPLISGGCILLKGGDTEERLKAALKDNRLSFLKLTPSHLKMLDVDVNRAGLPKLQSLIVGGEELTTDTAGKTQKLLGQGVKIHNEYGPTEATVGCCDYIYSENTDSGMSVGIGRPISNTQIYIMNAMELCGIGIPGELCIAGDGVARGYLNQPELTAEKFIRNPYGEGRLYRSGDLARWLPDGNIEYLGRIDEQVKIRGFRIELGEIESVLRKQPGVSDAAVIAREAGGDKSLCAYLLAADGAQELDIPEIRNTLRKELPEYMIPSFMMQIEALPLNRNGKLDWKALPEPDALAGREYIHPRNEKEQAVVEVYQEILGVSPIGIEDSFFELGGDSIKAIRVVSKLRQKGYELSFADLMSQRTARLICENIQEGIATRVYEQGEVNGESSLIPIQREFFSKDYAVSSHYNQAMMLRSDEGFDIPSLKEAIAEVIKHHDALRNVYDGQRQITLRIEESKLYDWYEDDYSNAEDVAKEIRRASNKIQASIDLTEGPLVKIGLFHSDRGDHLLICVHHLVIDGVSWRIILEDLFNGYRQVQETGKITLPKKTASYKEWAEALVQYAESETLLDETTYWEKTAKKSENTEAFRSKRRAIGLYKTQAVEVDPETTQKLLFEAGKTYGTEINDLLLASLTVALNRWKNSKYITIEMEGHGREAIDTEIAIDRTVGWFTSVYPVVLETGATVEETIIETKEALRQVPNHGLGYGVLKYLGRWKGLETRAEITFNYLGELDNELDSIEGISMSEMPLGRSISKKNSGGTGLSLNGAVSKGRLGFDLTYDSGLYADEDVQTFVLAYEKAVKDVVETCLSREEVVKTPSDLTDTNNNPIQKHLDHYGNNYLKAHSISDCRVLTGQEIFLRQGTEIITDIIRIERGAKSVSSAIKKIISKQGALRTKLNEKMRHLEEYDYCDDWEIPIMKGCLGLSIEKFKKIVNEIDFLAEGKLLSRFLILEIDENNCLVLSAIHHLVWDGVSQDLFKTMINEALMNRFNTQNDYSFIKYCKMIRNQVEGLEISYEQEVEIERYLEAAKKASKLISRRDPKSFTDIHVELNDLQMQKFNEYPNKTAMEFLSGLMYSDLSEELSRIPFAVLTHNRNELNKGMLGLTLNLDYLMYDIKNNTQNQILLALGKSSTDKCAITEKLMLKAQKYGFGEMISLIPIINYQGILHKFASRDAISLEKMFLETVALESEGVGVGMHFYTQNNILMARVTGIKIEEELVKEVMKNI